MADYLAVIGIRIPIRSLSTRTASCCHIEEDTKFKYCPECGTKVQYKLEKFITEEELGILCGKYRLHWIKDDYFVYVGNISKDVEFIDVTTLRHSLADFIEKFNIKIEDIRIGLFLIKE